MVLPGLPDITREVKESLWVRAIGDKLLVDGKIRYMMFFESDEPFRGGPNHVGPYRLFPTPNGWHVIGEEIGNSEKKRYWSAAWRECYPESDYCGLGSWMFLRPHTKAEATFILTRSNVEPQTVKYYRDKAVMTSYSKSIIRD